MQSQQSFISLKQNIKTTLTFIAISTITMFPFQHYLQTTLKRTKINNNNSIPFKMMTFIFIKRSLQTFLINYW